MGLALFAGPRPVATWTYKLIETPSTKAGTASSSSKKKNRAEKADELIVTVNTGTPPTETYSSIHPVFGFGFYS
eukprot:COSAG05_NODE_8711_length_678_cov_1.307427_2_plen_73_part_01